MARRQSGEINAGSMADIAFLLLIFFLVTTTMDKDTGIMQLLPPPTPDDFNPPPVKDRNVFEVKANANNQLLVEKNIMDISELKDAAIEFYTNPDDRADLPELVWVRRNEVEPALQVAQQRAQANPEDKEAEKNVKKLEKKMIALDLLGGDFKTLPNSAIISLQNDRGTSYDLYVQVQDELAAALHQLRNQLSKSKFNREYDSLDEKSDEDQQLIIAIREKYPSRVSEAEAKATGAGAAPAP